jgi:halocyanin-like protein
MLAGCTGTGANANSEAGRPEFDGWLSGVDDYDGVVDAAGRSLVTVVVGPDAEMSFDPVAVRVDVGTTVRWEWAGGGSAHNVAAADGSFESAYHTAAGATFERTFEESGVVKYLCVPHEYAAMKGVVVT